MLIQVRAYNWSPQVANNRYHVETHNQSPVGANLHATIFTGCPPKMCGLIMNVKMVECFGTQHFLHDEIQTRRCHPSCSYHVENKTYYGTGCKNHDDLCCPNSTNCTLTSSNYSGKPITTLQSCHGKVLKRRAKPTCKSCGARGHKKIMDDNLMATISRKLIKFGLTYQKPAKSRPNHIKS
ncbi:hypothetical protein GE061_004079 [Apolygus lucorum]|uniref:Uncharacterized protein n=1 Tax=Apolygus lucorum TaxID=248454 RepID=A0A8S9X259_APOLU|nr:hypothetical protein GE061_004079 [Apolygus lucorum]